MWNRLGEMEDTKCLIPDRCYATMYQEMISYLKSNNQFDVATMGNVVSCVFFLPDGRSNRVMESRTDSWMVGISPLFFPLSALSLLFSTRPMLD